MSTKFYTESAPEGLADDLAQLTPAQARLYALRMATDPPRTARSCAEMLGISLGTTEKAWKQIKAKLGRDPLIAWKEKGVISQSGAEDFERLRNVSNDTMVKLVEMRIESMMRGITKDKIAEASLKDLTSGARDLGNFRQLLKGEPTQILQVNQRQNLMRQVMPQLMREFQRRGLSLEIDAVNGARAVKRIEPAPAEMAESP